MERLTPEPKTVLRFDGGHMGAGPEQRELLERIIAATRSWLEADGALAR